MRRVAWLVGMAALVGFGDVDRADASPLTLSFSGSAFSTRITPDPRTMDVSDGFSMFYQSGGLTFGGEWNSDNPYYFQFDSPNYPPYPHVTPIQVTATLSDADRILATVQFSAPVTGTLTWSNFLRRYESDTVRGLATGVVTIAPGVDPGLIPPWLTGMTATLESYASGGGGQSYISSILRITPADPAPVPEPSSVLVFLAAAGLVGCRRLRRV